MIDRVIHHILTGLNQLRLNVHYLLAAALLIVLPALYLYVAHISFETSLTNQNTVEKEAISLLHDSIALNLQEGVSKTTLQLYIESIVQEDNRITKAKVIEDRAGELVIVQSGNLDEIGLTEGAAEQFKATAVTNDSLIFNYTLAGIRTWQAFREVRVGNETFYIFTEHSFERIDTVTSNRQQDIYLGLSVVFLFFILLAYWLLKQTHWQVLYRQTKNKLDEQMLFTNSVAHELRAPLTAIKGYASFLKESPSVTADERTYADNIGVSTDRLIALINDFLEVARIQSGKLKIEFAETDIRHVISRVQTEFAPVAEAKGLAFDIKVPKDPIMADTDPKRLQQVITNLVSNALKYTEKGSIMVELSQTKLKTIIAIKDTGHGISGEDQQKLFQAFTRVGGADKSSTTGTGLGMWITKQLVALLHGTVTVESIEGIGTHLKLTFDV